MYYNEYNAIFAYFKRRLSFLSLRRLLHLLTCIVLTLAKHKFLDHRKLIVRESAAWEGVKADKPP